MLIVTGNDRRFSSRSAQTRFSLFPNTRTEKPALTLLPSETRSLGLGPWIDIEVTSRQVWASAALLKALPGPDTADKGLSGFEISPCPLRSGDKRMSGRLRPAAHGTNIELRHVGCHQDVVHRYIQQGSQSV